MSVRFNDAAEIAAVNEARKISTVCFSRKLFAYNPVPTDGYNNTDNNNDIDVCSDVQFSTLDTSTAAVVEMKALS